jgi:hypothetical protein
MLNYKCIRALGVTEAVFIQISAKQTEDIFLIYKYCKNGSKFVVTRVEILCPPGCYAMWTGKLLPTFQKMVLFSTLGRRSSLYVYQSKRCKVPENLNLVELGKNVLSQIQSSLTYFHGLYMYIYTCRLFSFPNSTKADTVRL